jgi:hypothetical protein
MAGNKTFYTSKQLRGKKFKVHKPAPDPDFESFTTYFITFQKNFAPK